VLGDTLLLIVRSMPGVAVVVMVGVVVPVLQFVIVVVADALLLPSLVSGIELPGSTTAVFVIVADVHVSTRTVMVIVADWPPARVPPKQLTIPPACEQVNAPPPTLELRKVVPVGRVSETSMPEAGVAPPLDTVSV
jgi:hypothetical protein